MECYKKKSKCCGKQNWIHRVLYMESARTVQRKQPIKYILINAKEKEKRIRLWLKLIKF